MSLLWNTFYFILALGILVTIHELGHFWVARKLGVKVLTFSIGFGKPLWQRKGKDGVNYVVAAIPLGGYVKMLGEQDDEIAPGDLQYAFNRKSVWARIAIVIAGPLANFILAIFLYWWMYLLGITGLSTQVGQIDKASIAGQAGLSNKDVISAVDGSPVFLMQGVVKSVAARIGDKETLQLSVTRDNETEKNLALSLKNWVVDDESPDLLGGLGIRHVSADVVIKPEISFVDSGTPADKAGLKAGDLITAFNDKPVADWAELVQMTVAKPNKLVNLIIDREGELKHFSVVIGSRELNGAVSGYLGVRPNLEFRSQYLVTRKGTFLESLVLALKETGSMLALSGKLFYKLITGDLSPKSLSGPISIAEGAGGSAKSGLVYFISFVAMISVNLGFINLLPVPLLDGGHLLFYLVEAVKGRPLSDKVQQVGMQIGMILVFSIMALAIFNDLSRL